MKSVAVMLSILVFWLLLVLAAGCESKPGLDTTESSVNATYSGSESCKACHPEQFRDWKLSDHYRSMQPATDSTVTGDFNDASYTADGVRSHFFKRQDTFFIHTQGDEGKYHDYPVSYTFGYDPLQQYLIAFPKGRLQTTRLSWDAKNKSWFHQYAGQKLDHREWIHWTGNGQNWNTMCASCHSTGLKKNYRMDSDTYQTSWSELNVGCESCHGPAAQHISFVNSAAYKEGQRIHNAGFQYGKSLQAKVQLSSCAPCHARKTDISDSPLRADELLDDLIPQVISNEFYFADGQIKEEEFEYGSFSQSRMYKNNVRCSNCHNPHSGKLLQSGNALCLNCHKPEYATVEHHHHASNTLSSNCTSCHMPEKTYMGIDQRRDHSFRIPRPDQSVAYGTPNTCNGCHTRKSPEWAAAGVRKWYGPLRRYHFSDDLLPGSLLNKVSEPHLLKLLADTSQPEIARATAAYYLGNLSSQASLNGLLNALHDEGPLVRYHALQSLDLFPPEQWVQDAAACLSDKVRAVRIAAASLFHKWPGIVPGEQVAAYQRADSENKSYLYAQTDFAVGNVMLADYRLQANDRTGAIRSYLRGLEKDSMMNYARINLATAYSMNGNNPAALKVLKDAVRVDPGNSNLFFKLALVEYEMNHMPEAQTGFRKAIEMGTDDSQVYYNYGLLLQQMNKMKEAEQIFLSGISINENAWNIRYALSLYYLQTGRSGLAREQAVALFQADPGNRDYQPLFRKFGF